MWRAGVTNEAAYWRRRFADFVAAREREARTAAIPPLTTDIDRGQESSRHLVAIGNEWTKARFHGPFYLLPLPANDASRRPQAGCTPLSFSTFCPAGLRT